MNFDREETQAPAELATEIDHRKLSRTRPAPRRDDYTPQERALALSIYADTGSLQTVSDKTGIPRNTLAYWIESNPEIDAELDAIRYAIRTKVAHTYAEIARRSAEELLDRVNHGDYHVDKEGNVTRKPIPGRELAFISSVAADKHALLTATTVRKGEDASLQKLADGLLAAIETRTRKAKAVDALQHDEGRNSAD